MKESTCKKCLYFRLVYGIKGRCHRFPPEKQGMDSSDFTMVEESDWCGEFKKGKGKETK